MVLAQLFVPSKMIFDSEKTLTEGKEFVFRTAPIDPYDAFRGKYVRLNFADNSIKIPKDTTMVSHQKIFLIFETDNEGFAKIKSISKTKPSLTLDYINAEISSIYIEKDNYIVNFNFPFDRFYMEETKAPLAETVYNEISQDRFKKAYAKVNIKDGNFVLKDILIENIPIKEYTQKHQDSLK
jgi:uncharacterized membrane-anchored protein